ncbi:glycosyltransferase family 2 protein [bacterium]|nr:glycosyltransferase family 2 protein [bacterium]
MNLVAIMIVRNEESYLPRCLEHLGAQGLKAAVIDNDSTDSTRNILEESDVVMRIAHAPFNGIFEWQQLLQQAHDMQQELGADWLHLNSPDEIFNSNRPGERLIDAIQRIESEGYTAINYNEFVFVPTDEKTNCEGKAFDKLLRHYYFFEPAPIRQMRTWKNIKEISNVKSGGHGLSGADLRIYPENLHLRHYIALSAEQFRRKYAGRKFPEKELARGWHRNRTNIDTVNLNLPSPDQLKHLAGEDLSILDNSDPRTKHFWE